LSALAHSIIECARGADINKDGKLQWRDFELARDVSLAYISVTIY